MKLQSEIKSEIIRYSKELDFIDLLHYCRENKISEENLEATASRLVSLCTQSITTEKLTALLGNKPREEINPGVRKQPNGRYGTETAQTDHSINELT